MLGSAGQKVHKSITEGEVNAEVTEFGGQFGWDDGVESQA